MSAQRDACSQLAETSLFVFSRVITVGKTGETQEVYELIASFLEEDLMWGTGGTAGREEKVLERDRCEVNRESREKKKRSNEQMDQNIKSTHSVGL